MPAAARRPLDLLRGGLDRETLHDAKLVVSELVANAVTHGAIDGGRTSITAWLSPTHLQIEVDDFGPGFRPTVGLADPGLPQMNRRYHRR